MVVLKIEWKNILFKVNIKGLNLRGWELIGLLFNLFKGKKKFYLFNVLYYCVFWIDWINYIDRFFFSLSIKICYRMDVKIIVKVDLCWVIILGKRDLVLIKVEFRGKCNENVFESI